MQKMLLMKNRCFYEKIREKVLQKSKNDSKKKLGKKFSKNYENLANTSRPAKRPQGAEQGRCILVGLRRFLRRFWQIFFIKITSVAQLALAH